MSTKKQVFIRLGFSDVVLTQEENDRFNGHVELISEDDGELLDDPIITSTEAYIVGWELEDGTECNQDGNPL